MKRKSQKWGKSQASALLPPSPPPAPPATKKNLVFGNSDQKLFKSSYQSLLVWCILASLSSFRQNILSRIV